MKHILLTSVLILTNIGIKAQGWEIGFNVKPQLTTLTVNKDERENLRPFIRLSGGIDIIKMFNEKTGISTGLMYSPKGIKFYNEVTSNGPIASSTSIIKGSYRYNYLVLPVKFRYIPYTKNKFSITTELGVFLAYNSKVRYKYDETYTFTQNGVSSTSIEYYDIEDCDNIKKVDAGVLIATGVQYKITEKVKLITALEYEYSIPIIFRIDLDSPDRYHHSVLGLKLGLLHLL